MRRTLENALDGCLVDVIREELESRLVIEAHRAEGQKVGVRFLGVLKWEATSEPPPESPIHLGSVGSGLGLRSLLGLINPFAHQAIAPSTRVRIEVGPSRLVIDCQDVEWWQDESTPGPASAT
jgi:hypothetical protein